MLSCVIPEFPITTCALHSLRGIIKESAEMIMQKQERIIRRKRFDFEVVI